MISLTLDEVLKGVGTYSLPYKPAAGVSFSDVINDSRQSTKGALFVALRAERDGHDFIGDACRRGASGVIAERLIDFEGWLPEAARPDFAYIVVENSLAALQNLSAYWRRRFDLQVIGVTGSVGKTSTKEMIASVLGRRFAVLKNEKNLNNEIGLPLSVLHLSAAYEKAVLEMGMSGLGEIAALCRIAQPSVGVVTNISQSHMEQLGSIARIAQAKSELLQALPTDGLAILNGDERLVRQIAEQTQARRIYYGMTQDCDVRARNVRVHGLDGISFDLLSGGRKVRVRSPLLGRHGVYPSLAAATAGLALGLSLDDVVEALTVPPTTVRVQPLAGKNGSIVIDDAYNASPFSMSAALDYLRRLPGRRIAILGDMFELGSYEEKGHRLVGRRAAKSVDKLIVVGQRARWVGEEARRAGMEDVEFYEVTAAVDVSLRPNDYVLVKGSHGMRMDTIVARLVEDRK